MIQKAGVERRGGIARDGVVFFRQEGTGTGSAAGAGDRARQAGAELRHRIRSSRLT